MALSRSPIRAVRISEGKLSAIEPPGGGRAQRSQLLRRVLLLALMAAGLGFGAYHRTPLTDLSDTNALNPALSLTNGALRRISPDVFGLGLVRLDTKKRTISFPAKVNMSTGSVEYALVRVTGKVHESVLATETDPIHIQLAGLLVGPAPTTNQWAAAPQAAPDLRGPSVRIWVQWTLEGSEKRVLLEDLVTNTLTKSTMSRGPWVFNGSRTVQGAFLAQRDGSVVAIIADPDAMVNSPRPGRDNDDIWQANGLLLPRAGTPVEITIELAQLK